VDALSEEDVLPLRALKVKGIKEKLIITRREIERKEIKAVPLWKFSTER